MRKFLLIIALFSASFTFLALAQDDKPNSNFGISLEGGFSHMFLGPNLSPVGFTTPSWGGGGGAALFYELQYKHFLFRTGFGMDYTRNMLKLDAPDYNAVIAEYPTMVYHYDLKNYSEYTNYGIGYVPVYFGGLFRRFFFLAGAKVGVLPFGGSTQPKTDATIWATDADVIDPMEGLYTHYMTDYTFTGEKTAFAFNRLNAMASIEVGLNLDKRAWADEKELKRMNKAQRYANMRKKKPFKDCLHYRLSLFADYGLSNLMSPQHSLNPVENPQESGTSPAGGLVAFNSVNSITPYSVYGYEPHHGGVLNNMMIGLKFAIMYEVPHKAPKKGSMAYPYIYTYVTNELTGKPVGGATVSTAYANQPKKKPVLKTTDSQQGRVGKAYPAGKYDIVVSKSGYYPHDTIHFVHEDRYDTLYVQLYPQQTFRAMTTDAKTGRPIGATVTIYDEAGNAIFTTSVDSAANTMSTILDGRKRYRVCAQAKGYLEACDSVSDVTELKNLRLEPIRLRKFILQNMFFATDKTKILPTSEGALQELYKLLSENPSMRIRIIGHTDDVASDAYNQKLSEGRAKSVRKEMIDRGIDGKRIETEGRGESDPIVANDSDEHRQMNRRVEIEILSSDEEDTLIQNEQLRR